MRKLPPICLLVLSLLCLNGMADTITLKDGTVIDGKITQESDAQVTVSIQVSDTISDERVLNRADIAKIDKTAEDGLAFDQIKAWKPDAWAMLAPETYKNTIDALNAFLQKYPQSTHVAEVHTMLDTFVDEQKHQQAGEVKLYGLWISPKEAAARAIQIQAQTLYLKMQAAAAQGNLVGALNAFDQLEKGFSITRVYPAAIDKAKTIITELQLQVARASDNLKLSNEKWQEGVAITAEPQRSQIIAARQNENSQYEATLAAAKKGGGKWPPFITQSQKSMDGLLALIGTEKIRLTALPVENMNASIAASDKASEAVSANDLNTASALLSSATGLWSANEEAAYLQKFIDDSKAAKANPQAGGAPVAKVALRPTPKIAGATPTPTPKPTPAMTPVPPAAPDQDENPGIIGFFFTIKGAITVVGSLIALIVILSYFQKRKKNGVDEEDEE